MQVESKNTSSVQSPVHDANVGNGKYVKHLGVNL